MPGLDRMLEGLAKCTALRYLVEGFRMIGEPALSPVIVHWRRNGCWKTLHCNMVVGRAASADLDTCWCF